METPATPFYVFIEHILQVQPDQQQPPIHLLRLIPEMGHLNFVARVRSNKYDCLRLPWHFIQSIAKCQKNPLHLMINLHASKYQSPAFQSNMPEYYFPKCQRVIVVKFSDRQDRHDFVQSLELNGLILKTNVAHEYVPQTLEFKWEHLFLPQQITKTNKLSHKNGKQKFEYIWKQNMCIPLVIPQKLRIDETQVYQLEDLSHEERKLEELRQKLLKAQALEREQESDDDYHTAIGEEDDSVEDEDDYYTAIGEDEGNSVVAESSFYTAEDNQQDSSVKSEEEQEEEDYVVFDEKDDSNYPRIVFEIGLGPSEIQPLKFNCKSENPEPTCFERICF